MNRRSEKLPFYILVLLAICIAGCSSSVTSNTDSVRGIPEVDTEPEPSGNAVLILKEDFEAMQSTGLYNALNRHRKLDVVEGVGRQNSQGLEATYVGYDRGSERIVVEFPLGERSDVYTLCYDIRFDEDFQFVRGGKIMGLGPDKKVTGGNAVSPGRWSARSNFGEEGVVHTYVYSQNKNWKWGESVHSDKPAFTKGTYHKVTLQVQLNDPPATPNGISRIYVDGQLQVSHENIQYRKVAGDSTLISKLLLETFHGGNVPSYAPRDKNGNYTTVKAYFDNIEVYRGLNVCTAG